MSPDLAPRRSSRHDLRVASTLALCGIVVSLQHSLVVPVLPRFPAILDVSAANASWLITITLLTGTTAIPVVTRLADLFGKRRMLLLTLGMVSAGSVVGGLGSSFEAVLAARAMQGVGLALVPVGIAVMREEMTPERTPVGVAMMSTTLAVGAGAGLPLSGVVVEHLGWHALFWVVGTMAAIMALCVLITVPAASVRARGSFDYAGAAVLTAALGSGLLALSMGSSWGWASPRVLLLVTVFMVLMGLFVPLELWIGAPLVNLRVAARSSVLWVNVASPLVGFAMFLNMLVTAPMLQLPELGFGMDILSTGLWMSPLAVTFGLTAPVAVFAIRRWGAAATLSGGALLMSVTYAARISSSEELWSIVAGSVLVAAGTSFCYAAMPLLVMRDIPDSETASANGLNNLLRYAGTAVSGAAVGAAAGTSNLTRSDLTLLLALAGASSLLAALVTVPLFRAATVPPVRRPATLTAAEPELSPCGNSSNRGARGPQPPPDPDD